MSSRRRHTRLQGDWSSDVCSSDLMEKREKYDPEKSLRQEVERFMATNLFTPMDVTNFYAQARVVLNDYKRAREYIAELERKIGRASCRERGVWKEYGGAS